MVKKKLVIVGGGGAGLFCGATVLQMSKEFDVYMISDEDLYCRCTSPYVLNNKANLKDAIMPDTMITQFGIKLLKGYVQGINHDLKIVRYGDSRGTAKVNYDVLMFATGARPAVPPIPGVDLKNVFSVRTSDDIGKINSLLSKVKSAVVVGGGVIGVEMAAALRERNVKTKMIIIEDKPFEVLADEEFTVAVEKNLSENGIEIINKAILRHIGGDSRVESVSYEKDGKSHVLKADLVILATGVKANKELAASIGVRCVKEGIIVDNRMMTNINNVYAAGDVVLSTNYVTKTKTLSQLATNAVIQGKIAGKNIAGYVSKYKGHTSAMMVQFLGEEFGCCGVSEKWCKETGVAYYTGVSHSTDIYRDLKGSHNVLVKLIFNAKNNRVIGVQAYGRNLVWIVNLISYAVMNNSTVFDLMELDYASHPSVSPWPFMDPIVDASEHALQNMIKMNSRR